MSRLPFYVVVVIATLGSGAAGYLLRQYQSQTQQSEAVALPPKPVVTTAKDVTGQILPEFSLPDIHGRVHSIHEWDGKVVAINFWASWCEPCMQEIPSFITLQDKYAKQGLQFLGIALQNPNEIKEFVATHGINYPVLAGEAEVIDLATALGNDMGTLPYTVIIDRKQRISFIKNGLLDRVQAEAVITTLL